MQRAEAMVAERRQLAAVYDDAGALDYCKLLSPGFNYGHGYQSHPCLFQPKCASSHSNE